MPPARPRRNTPNLPNRTYRDALPPPSSGSSPEDPFFLLRSLDEIAAALNTAADRSSSYGSIRAFQRVAPRGDYQAAKALFDGAEILRTNENSLETIASMALKAGQRSDAEDYLNALKKLADEKGSWGGGWTGSAKQRYYRLRVALFGDPARQEAFDSLLSDLRNRGEYVDFLLPELPAILEIIAPTVTWSAAWEHLAEHIRQFREFRASRDVSPSASASEPEERVLADILFRAIGTTSMPLTEAARAAAIELAGAPSGQTVTALLVRLLWHSVGYYRGYNRLEAAQIAWECQRVATVRTAVSPFLAEMAAWDDMAVRRIALKLGDLWGESLQHTTNDLPPIYTLELPRNAEAGRFTPPSGMTSSEAGLYTENPLDWTWATGDSLRLVAKASGIPIGNLRTRTAQLMERLGGTNAFGPDAARRQLARLERLELRTSYRKLMNAASFQAVREVVGELDAAHTIEPEAVPFILTRAAALPLSVTARSPEPRPVGVPSPALPGWIPSEKRRQWVDAAEEDCIAPTIAGHVVLAATAVHNLRYFQEEFTVEQYFGPELRGASAGLFEEVMKFPRVFVTDQVTALNVDPGPGLVVHPEPCHAGVLDLDTLMFCPVATLAFGWNMDPEDTFVVRNEAGEIVVRTMFWRDGGVVSHRVDHTAHRHGCVVLLRHDQLAVIRRYLADTYVARAWRRVQQKDQSELIGSRERSIAIPA